MPGPIAHCSMVALLRPLERRGLLPDAIRTRRLPLIGVLLFACVMPDLDFAIGWFAPGSALGTHGIGTHSLFMTAIASLVLTSLWWVVFRKNAGFVLLLLIVASWSHLLFDMLTYRGRGIGLLWPFIDERIRLPWNLFFGLRHGEWWWWQAHILTLVTESAFAGLIWGLSSLLSRKRSASKPQRAEVEQA